MVAGQNPEKLKRFFRLVTVKIKKHFPWLVFQSYKNSLKTPPSGVYQVNIRHTKHLSGKRTNGWNPHILPGCHNFSCFPCLVFQLRENTSKKIQRCLPHYKFIFFIWSPGKLFSGFGIVKSKKAFFRIGFPIARKLQQMSERTLKRKTCVTFFSKVEFLIMQQQGSRKAASLISSRKKDTC